MMRPTVIDKQKYFKFLPTQNESDKNRLEKIQEDINNLPLFHLIF